MEEREIEGERMDGNEIVGPADTDWSLNSPRKVKCPGEKRYLSVVNVLTVDDTTDGADKTLNLVHASETLCAYILSSGSGDFVVGNSRPQ